MSKESGIAYLALTAALFFLPYILFSAYAGYLSDRYSKSTIVRATKLLEVVIMLIALVSFSLQSSLGLMIGVFLMGSQSAFFSPSKYGILPEMLDKSELSKANGYLEFSTFLAIIFGTAGAGFLSNESLGNPGIFTLLIAIIGVITSYGVDHLPPSGAKKSFSLDPFTPNFRNLREIYLTKVLWLSVLGIAFFWSLGALFQLNILLFAKETLKISDMTTSLLLAAIGLGIGFGSIFAGKASEGKVELGLVPLGALGIVLTNVFLFFVGKSLPLTFITVFLLGVSSGFFIVPVQTYLQEFSPKELRGSYLAASNFFSFVCMLSITFLFWILSDYFGITPETIFLIMGIIAIGVSIYLIRLLPEVLTRCINWLALHLLYRIKKIGVENVPREGGALIVCNHVTFVDAMLLLASLPRPIRFIMYRPIYNNPIIYPIAKLMKALPISGKDGRESLIQTLKEASALIENGELVGIFAEGGLTRSGEIQEFRTGLETIMEGLSHPIIPTHLGGLWGSIFSHFDGRVLWRWPKKIPYPVTITFGAPVPATTKASELEEIVRKLSSDE